jgi:hypothetical protein
MYCLCIFYLQPPKPAGLDPQKNIAGIPQIGCGTLIAKKIIHGKLFLDFFLLKTWFAEICKADPRVYI